MAANGLVNKHCLGYVHQTPARSSASDTMFTLSKFPMWHLGIFCFVAGPVLGLMLLRAKMLRLCQETMQVIKAMSSRIGS